MGAGQLTAQSVADDARLSLAAGRSLRVGSTLALALDGALRRLEERANAFAWPTEGFPFENSRFATVPAQNQGDLTATLPDMLPNQSGWIQGDKLLSRSFSAASPADSSSSTGLEAGDYTLRLGLGDKTESLDITVEQGWTNGEVLNAVAQAVNNSTLDVQAEVRSQTGSGILNPETVKTGSFLALTVDRASADQNASLTDTTGHLAGWLGLTDRDLSALPPGEPATLGTLQTTSLAVARPSLYQSRGFDPEAETTLAPGTYTVAYAVGPASGSVYGGEVSITVTAGDTWREVLASMANALGSASPAMAAQLVPARRVWDSATDELHAVVDGVGMSVSAVAPKQGWRLSLSDGTTDAGADNILSATGLNVTAQPGSDGVMVIDGRERTSATNTFTADRGRVVLDLAGTFGETVPVSISGPFERLADGLADVVNAYNGLRDLLLGNADVLRDGLAEDWRTPVAERASALADVGLRETGRDKLLWLSADDFLTALAKDPSTVRAALLGDGALLPALGEKAAKALEDGAEALLKPREEFPERDPMLRSPTLRSELEVEKANQLLDLYDTKVLDGLPAAPWETGGGLLRRRG